ncbi:hypothetical protein KC332_g8548 [Hortaea werneckii]|uniref:Uncharacterized protein n=1 Tax=Hortaea werneckii TaxID=91943 RepID=A0A3M7I956_HORWE|nr:hypothetical protein KC358_g8372 [Hortaea werneckii]KAI6926044.1 hypothetical protein KC348_g8805 [Hortaea werneckii]KAI6933555.1 hypothetical protein KC341_g8224 [Hortaea werneckii]KAI6968113.1 hypothetical protein KC321_g8642 [Hortaea werneckii]KAI6983362.1 hypothetical protein KC329_g8570 [Hortaea werneckii]
METITSTFKPHRERCGRPVKLSPIDQIAPRDYHIIYFFFQQQPGVEKESIFRNLEQGLQATIAQIPELLCSVVERRGDRDELELVYGTENGAAICFKDYTSGQLGQQWQHGSFHDLEREHFPYYKLESRLLLATPELSGGQLRCLAMQANFIPGGLILSTRLHHLLCDGSGSYTFHSMLGRNVAAATNGSLSLSSPELELIDRDSIVSGESGVQLADLPDWRSVTAVGDSPEVALKGTSWGSAPMPKVRYAVYYISEANMKRLRDNLTRPNDICPSVVEAVGAFLWSSVLQVREVDCGRYPEAKLSITIDTRARMRNPTVSSSYWGNLSEPNAVARMPTHLLSHSHKADPGKERWRTTLPDAALRIKQATAAVDNAAVRRLVGLLNQMPKATSLTWNVDRWPGPDMLLVCVNKLPFNSIDFGPQLGCSEALRFTVGDTEGKPDGRCLVLPPRRRDGRGLEVALQYDEQTLERLRQSTEFAEYFEWRN